MHSGIASAHKHLHTLATHPVRYPIFYRKTSLPINHWRITLLLCIRNITQYTVESTVYTVQIDFNVFSIRNGLLPFSMSQKVVFLFSFGRNYSFFFSQYFYLLLIQTRWFVWTQSSITATFFAHCFSIILCFCCFSHIDLMKSI